MTLSREQTLSIQDGKGIIYIIGAGPGDPELITIKGYRILRSCDVIAGWRSVLERFPDLLGGKEVIEISYSTEKEDLERLARLAMEKCVAILVHGDPSVSDWQFMEKLRTLCRSRSIICEVISGVSSLNVALSKEGLDMAEIVFITLHAEGAEKYYEEILRILPSRRKIVVFPEPYRDGPQRVARYLIDRGFKGIATIYENLTYQDEQSYEYKLEDLAKEKRAFTDLCVLILEIEHDP